MQLTGHLTFLLLRRRVFGCALITKIRKAFFNNVTTNKRLGAKYGGFFP